MWSEGQRLTDIAPDELSRKQCLGGLSGSWLKLRL